MIEFIKNFFREGTKESSTRLILIFIAINAACLSWYGAIYGKNVEVVVLGMLSLVITGKVLSKSNEGK